MLEEKRWADVNVEIKSQVGQWAALREDFERWNRLNRLLSKLRPALISQQLLEVVDRALFQGP